MLSPSSDLYTRSEQPLMDRAMGMLAEWTGQAPAAAASAPGRVNLIGEHVDYNAGLVLPMAIERRTVIASVPLAVREARFRSDQVAGEVVIPLGAPLTRQGDGSGDYLRGVLAGFQAAGCEIPGFSAVVCSDVPLGGGLSSSASLEVALATLLEVLTGFSLTPLDKALLCQKAEHDFAGTPCGLMDQFVSVMAREGHALLMDCRSNDGVHIPLTPPCPAVLIINSSVKHALNGGEYRERREQCEAAAMIMGCDTLREATPALLAEYAGRMPAVVHARARHIISEIARTVELAGALRSRSWQAAGQLMLASHASLRDDFAVSCAELDLIVELAMARPGVWGCRMTGGGFGGSCVAFVEPGAVERVQAEMASAYQDRTGVEAQFIESLPSGGARALPV